MTRALSYHYVHHRRVLSRRSESRLREEPPRFRQLPHGDSNFPSRAPGSSGTDIVIVGQGEFTVAQNHGSTTQPTARPKLCLGGDTESDTGDIIFLPLTLSYE
jgi:hypothetical protein